MVTQIPMARSNPHGLFMWAGKSCSLILILISRILRIYTKKMFVTFCIFFINLWCHCKLCHYKAISRLALYLVSPACSCLAMKTPSQHSFCWYYWQCLGLFSHGISIALLTFTHQCTSALCDPTLWVYVVFRFMLLLFLTT